MKLGEKGYTLVELIISVSIIVAATGAAGGAIFQIFRVRMLLRLQLNQERTHL